MALVAHRLVPDDPGPSTFVFPPIATPLGAIVLRTQYRPHTRFRLDPLENLWSSALASPSGTPPSTATPANQTSPLSAGNPNTAVGRTPSSTSPSRVVDLDTPAFTPTLLSSRQRASLSGSGSPLRQTPASIASNLASNPNTNPNHPGGTVPFSPIRPRTVSQLSSGPIPRSPPTSPRLGMNMEFTSGGMGGASGLTRTRRESLLTGARSGANTPADAGPSALGPGALGGGADSPRRTPSTINAFKSATLASSPRTLALGVGMGGGGSPLGMGGSPRTTPGLGLGTSPRTGAGVGTSLGGSPSRRSIDSGAGESAGPSNLGGAAGGGLGVQPQPIKRYSSSFGHRPGRSEGSLGSGGIGSLGVGGAGVGVGSAGTGTGTGGSAGAGSVGTGGEGVAGVPGTSAGSGNPAGGHARRLTTIGVSVHILSLLDIFSNMNTNLSQSMFHHSRLPNF